MSILGLLEAVGAHALYEYLVKLFIQAVEAGKIPDAVLRRGIRFLLAKRAGTALPTLEGRTRHTQEFVHALKQLPIAINTSEANEQHYEVPTDYYLKCLGKHLKYSSCLYLTPDDNLDTAEANMLKTYLERAQLGDGQQVLELGCGWGSFSLFAAAAFPKSIFTAVSNSRTQREFIMGQAKQRGITNLTVLTANMIDFKPPATYDRIVSIEMFEHMKNYQALMQRISTWLNPEGLLFVHIFVHKNMPYHFEYHGEDDWMSKYFFTGGTMPSADLLLYFQDHMAIQGHWYVNGSHYSKTLEAWLVKHDRYKEQVMRTFEGTYKDQASVWFHRWRVFYIACSELFNFSKGEEWGVGHYLFKKRA